MSKKRIILILIVLVLIVSSGVYYYNYQNSQYLEVQIAMVESKDITQTVLASGKVQPQLEVNISSNVSGKIIEISVKEGEHVEEGQFLVQLDRDRYEASVEQAQALLSSAEANVRLSLVSMNEAKRVMERNKQLWESNLIPHATYEASVADYEISKARYDSDSDVVSQREATLRQVMDDLSKTRILSPIRGIVTRIESEVGEVVLGTQQAFGTTIMTIADLNKMEVLVEVDENDIVNVDFQNKVNIEIDAFPDTIFTGVVIEIANAATIKYPGTQQEVINFEVEITIEDDIPRLRPGMSASVEILTQTKENILTVPIQCITLRDIEDIFKEKEEENRRPGRRMKEKMKVASQSSSDASVDTQKKLREVVFVVNNEQAFLREVKTGISSASDIEIIEGLLEGERVVSGSYNVLSNELKDGDFIREE